MQILNILFKLSFKTQQGRGNVGKIKEFVADHLTDIIIIGAGLFFILSCWWFYTANRTANDYNNATQSVERAEEGINSAGKRLESAQNQIEDAQRELDRADKTTGRIKQTAGTNKKLIDECTGITDRMSERAGNIQAIIRNAETANQADGTQTNCNP